MAVASLGLLVVSLIAYMGIVGNASPGMFVAATVGASVAGVAGLVLAIVACRRGREEDAKPKIDWLATVSVAVAIGYLLCMGIMLLNIVVYWIR
jgi:hypothetical protein